MAAIMEKKSSIHYLYDFIKGKVNLPDFIERETGSRIIWYQQDTYAGSVCPMPSHREDKASFKIRLTNDGIWVYHCFGCGVKGTIIDFCMDYYGIDSSAKAVAFLCKKLNIKKGSELIVDSFKDIKKKINLQKKVECAHIVAANQCRNLLRKNYNQYNKWVAASYKLMNQALDMEDIDTIESIGYQATNKIQEK